MNRSIRRVRAAARADTHEATVKVSSHALISVRVLVRIQSDKMSSDIDMGDRYGRSDVNEISMVISIWNMGYRHGISLWDMGYRYGIWYVDMIIYHIDMVILDIDMAYGLMTWEMTVSIRSSGRSMWDILSL
jgi:hypothetical protein